MKKVSFQNYGTYKFWKVTCIYVFVHLVFEDMNNKQCLVCDNYDCMLKCLYILSDIIDCLRV